MPDNSTHISGALYKESRKRIRNPFIPNRKGFECTVKQTGIEQPNGQFTLVLLDTSASHFMLNCERIVLQKTPAYIHIKITILYVHFHLII